MKPKIIALMIFLWFLAACTPEATAPTPEIESRPTIIATAVAAATETIAPTASAVPTTSTPETAVPEPPAFTPRFDRYLPFSAAEGGTNSLTGLVRQGDGWQLERIPYPPGPVNEELGHALAIDSTGSDYAVATDRLLARTFAGGAGPDNLAAGKLFIVDLATETVEIIVPENIVSASWAPNGLDFAYILATDETYELRWRTADGADRWLAAGVPHTLEVSPDGRFVAFTRETGYDLDGNAPGLYVVSIETGLETQISSLDRAGYGGVGAYWRPHWTPDGSQVFLFATADDDRAATPHEAGYVWAATDGSFSHFLPEMAFLALFDKPLREPENRLCLDAPALFAANMMVAGIGECQPFASIPENSQPVYFSLDPQTGAVSLTNVLPLTSSAQLLTWDVPGESVLLLDDGVVFSQSVPAVATTLHFDRFLPFAEVEGSGNNLTGLIQQADGWQLATMPYPGGTYSTDSDYAPATNRLLAWRFAGGAGPGHIAVGSLAIIDVATEDEQVMVAENVVAAGWAPNGLDFAYILATPETYELRWRTPDGDDQLLAVDVPHSLRVSPDGRFVAFTRESHYEVPNTPPGLYVVDIETGVETQISPLDRAGYGGTGLYWKPHWTPDGSQVFLYATADDDRAATPHEEGYAWAAADGSFNHFLPTSSFRAFFNEEPLTNPDYVRCLGEPALFAANSMVLPVGECPPMGMVYPETVKFAYFPLDAQTGTVELVNIVPGFESARLLTWDVPGESVLLLDEGEVVRVDIE
ncbi:MAG: hypothetical protein CL608_21155 [Anaerolineaceae bacterium]|nr:hypothetical protein [Anaerolineaceae bacterium]